MRKLLSALIVVAVAVLMIGCGNANTPSGVAEASVKCLQKGDYKGYVELLTATDAKKNAENKEKFEQEQQMLVSLVQEKASKKLEKKEGIKSYEVLSEEINETGDRAKVTMTIVYGDGSEDKQTVKTKKDDSGKWILDSGK